MVKEGTHHLKFIAAGIASMVLMLVCLTGFVVSVAAGKGINTNVASSERVWNMGVITMEYSTYLDGEMCIRDRPKTIQRSEGKAVRVIDNRNL